MTREEALRIVIPALGAVSGPKVRPRGQKHLEFFYDASQVMPFRMRSLGDGNIQDWDWNWFYHKWEVIEDVDS